LLPGRRFSIFPKGEKEKRKLKGERSSREFSKKKSVLGQKEKRKASVFSLEPRSLASRADEGPKRIITWVEERWALESANQGGAKEG